MKISALEILSLTHIGNSLFMKEFLAQRSTSAIFGTLTPSKLSIMQFLMYLEKLLNSWTNAVQIFAFEE